ncbi:Fe-S cluster assembly protein HesB [Pontibacter sp. HJ8]
MTQPKNSIWTFGHSTRSPEEFVAALQSFQIEVLVDVRRYPGSRKYPHFSAEALHVYLPEAGIRYVAAVELGGRRKPKADSANTAWRSESFRGYADYSETKEFEEGIAKLTEIASQQRTAYMCSEAVWWRCHRAIISDYLKERGWTVLHIMSEGSAKEHPYTSAYLETH